MNSINPICPVCHLGKLKTQKITYTQVFEGQFIAIPNVLALVCDVCGEKVFDNEMLTRLSGLLGQDRRSTTILTSRHFWG
jgi:YgiT-type zinc finger domain-containing protein